MKANPVSEEHIRRREFLRLLSTGAAGALGGGALLSLAGCGSGDSGGNTPVLGGGTVTGLSIPTTQNVAGSVNRSEIGGANLSIQSIYQRDSAVSAGGGYSSTVSSQGSQLLVATDSDGKVRGAMVNVPGASAAMDAVSTAMALVYLSPGLGASAPTLSSQRQTEIMGLSSFGDLVSFLRQILPGTSLNELQANSALESLKSSCILDWSKSHQPPTSRAFSDTKAGLTINVAGPAPVSVTLSNAAFRFLSVVREFLDTSGRTVGSPQPVKFATGVISMKTGLLDGAQPVDWGNLWQATALMPTVGSDAIDFSTVPSAGAVRYWAWGPGSATNGDTPTSFDPSLFDQSGSIGATLIAYFAGPLIDRIVGAIAPGSYKDGAAAAWAVVQGSLSVAPLVTAFTSGDYDAVKAGLVNLGNNFLTVLASSPQAVADLGLTGLINAGFNASLEEAAVMLTAANLAILASDLFFLPQIASVTASISAGQGNIQ